MALFNKSYATSEQLEMSRIAASSSPSSQQQLSTSLLRSTRHIPPELRAPPYNPDFTIAEAETEEDTDDPFNQRGKLEQRVLDNTSLGQVTSPSMACSSGSRQEQERKRARTSQIGKFLFPQTGTNAAARGSPRTKRHSYSGSDSTLPRVVLNPLSASTSSLPAPYHRSSSHALSSTTKMSRSPSNAQSRTAPLAVSVSSSSSLSSASTSLTSANDDALLALPLAKQLRSLKERNSELAQASSTSNAKLAQAHERIQHLEEKLTSVEADRGVDAEGWEAEASRLGQELAILQRQQADRPNFDELESRATAAERSLAVEQAKKRRAKEMINKLRCELNNRRWKEKYEIELLEKEERNWEIKVVESDCEAALLRGELGCERAEREELESIVALQKQRMSTLAASKKVLLDSFSTSEKTISSLRTSLSAANAERDRQIGEMKEEVESLKEELNEARTKGDAGEAKVQAKNQQLEGQLKDVKGQLKVSHSALKSAEDLARTANSALESAEEALAALQARYDALLATTSASTPPTQHSSSTVKARPVVKEKKRAAPEPEPESEVEAEESVAPEPSPSPKRKAPVKAAKSKGPAATMSKKKKVASVDEEEGESENDDRPVAQSVVAAKKPKTAKTSSKNVVKPVKPVISDAEEGGQDDDDDDDDDDEETPRPTPVSPPPVKKRKAEVLADKSINSKKDKGTTNGTTKVKKDKSGGKKQKLTLDLSEDEAPPAPKEEKKKKRKLFGDGAKKGFDWQTQIENADVNGSLIPGNLSPIKLDRTKGKKTGVLGFGMGGGVKKSIF